MRETDTHGSVAMCTGERGELALGEGTFQLHDCAIPRERAEMLLTAAVCGWERLLMVQTPLHVPCTST